MSAKEYQAKFGSGLGNQNVAKKPQIRLPKPVKMNKTEAEYFELLKREFHPAINNIQYEPISLRLPSGTLYTPDFVVWNGKQLILLVECKGAHIHSSASIRAFKEARAAFPWIPFRFAQKQRGGDWAIAE